MITDQDKNILTRLRKVARSKSQKCYNPSCEDEAIRSHIQQLKGPISLITSANGKVIQLEDLNPFFNKNTYGFKEKGIKQKGDVLTFWGFCNKCDSKIFKDIEIENVDYSKYNNQLLFSYRGFLSEFYKQEYNIKHYESIFKSNELSEEVKESYKYLYAKYNLSLMFDKHIKKLFEKDLNDKSINFKFISVFLPRLDVCTSTAYSIPTPILLDDNLKKVLKNRDSLPPVTNVNFINLIPTKNNSVLILGNIADNNLNGGLDLDKIMNLNQNDKIKLISDILIRHIETWFVSVSLYNKWKQRKMDVEIIKQIIKYLSPSMKTKHLKFNMFKDII